jgi:predicted aldo/keto reductase-like oxidoreductase
MSDLTRRHFIKGVIGAGVSLAAADGIASISSGIEKINPYDAKGLPVTELGSTGVLIPKIVLGLGSRFCHIDDDDEALEMANYALNNGFYYWDTAHAYDNTIGVPPGKKKSPRHIISEVRLGEIVKYRRKEIFLSTKVTAREPSESMKEIELSLKRLNADKLDMLMIHDVHSLEDVEQMSKKGHLIDILQKLKQEGVTKYIGFSGHGDAQALKEMANRAGFDNMLIAMNHWNPNQPSEREEIVIPTGKKNKMGILLMKIVRPKETVKDLRATDLIRYGLTLKGPDAIVLGMDSKTVVDSNLNILRTFKKLSHKRMKELAMQLEPFYKHENLPWMNNNYIDGFWQNMTV